MVGGREGCERVGLEGRGVRELVEWVWRKGRGGKDEVGLEGA